MPLTRAVSFKARLQCGNLIQDPKYVRWHYKLEPAQTLEASVRFENLWRFQESFFCRITKDGRIIIPKVIIALFAAGKPNLNNHIADIKLVPSRA
jgi:hypothetical protein